MPENLAESSIYHHCPSWCGLAEGDGRGTDDDFHDGVHEGMTYGAGHRPFLAYVHLEQADLHGQPVQPIPDPYIVISNGYDQGDVRRQALQVHAPVARSLARALIHLADIEEL